jgi:hypothetical protein
VRGGGVDRIMDEESFQRVDGDMCVLASRRHPPPPPLFSPVPRAWWNVAQFDLNQGYVVARQAILCSCFAFEHGVAVSSWVSFQEFCLVSDTPIRFFDAIVCVCVLVLVRDVDSAMPVFGVMGQNVLTVTNGGVCGIRGQGGATFWCVRVRE